MKRLYIKGLNVIVEGFSAEPLYFPIRAARIQPRLSQIIFTDMETNNSYVLEFEEIQDSNGNLFGDLDSALDFLTQEIGGFKTVPGSSGTGNTGGTVDGLQVQRASGYSNFTDGTNVGDLAYTDVSQGTRFLPGSFGGTWYPKGFYVWNGTDWVSDKDIISQQIALNLNTLDEKAEKTELDTLKTTVDNHVLRTDNPHTTTVQNIPDTIDLVTIFNTNLI